MAQLDFHNINESEKKLPHTHTHTHTLPIIQRFVSVYKLWDEFKNHLPKKSKYALGTKIELCFLDILELLFISGSLSKEQKLPLLYKASGKLNLLKFFLQIAWELKNIDNKKYIMLSEHLNEIGKMLGGWIKGLQK
ncbi:four helix bundle protein [Candidatus Uhrbacteria bacterium]|nr:four helix bundle protein [Candidatus Uhrbacteria bacterium]